MQMTSSTELDFNTPMSRITRASLRSHSFLSSKLDSPDAPVSEIRPLFVAHDRLVGFYCTRNLDGK